MELDLLRRRAEKISGGIAGGDGLDDEFRLLPEESFRCSGTMTGLLLVGAARLTTSFRNAFPEIQLWRNNSGNAYTRQASEEIRLTPGDFSPDGVLQYNLTTPISFQSRDVLGVYQPDRRDSVVRVYYDSNTSTTYRARINITLPTIVDLLELTSVSNERILISPITG